MTHSLRRTALSALVALFLAAAPAARAQPYPAQKPITLVVPFAPGGGNDILARAIGPRLSQILNQAVIVENKPGAGGNVGTDAVARAPGDGYTLLIASNQITMNPALGIKTPFKVEKDFAPVGMIASVPIVLVANTAEPYQSLADFMQYAKAHPGKLSYSSPGNGTPQHLAGEVLGHLLKTPLVHVPYRGTGPAIADVIGGQVQISFGTMASVLPYLQAGRLRPLGIAGQNRSTTLPQLPTFGEAGLKNYEAALWYSLLVPAKTPRPVIDRLNAALVQVLKTPQTAQQLATQGFETTTSSPEELKVLIDKDLARWARVISEHNIKIEQ